MPTAFYPINTFKQSGSKNGIPVSLKPQSCFCRLFVLQQTPKENFGHLLFTKQKRSSLFKNGMTFQIDSVCLIENDKMLITGNETARKPRLPSVLPSRDRHGQTLNCKGERQEDMRKGNPIALPFRMHRTSSWAQMGSKILSEVLLIHKSRLSKSPHTLVA